MKLLIIALSFSLAAGATFARSAHEPAATASEPTAVAAAGSQQNKMKTCNADAKTKDLHGADRKSFMKQCLSGKAKPAAAS
ncbi:PsiF family protein [Scleromatobacter humisilvae]|uniref:PsiF family protein n=1 Tax=Scleromatobacter humisilvae TaxID=2897159 RepID=A0A9X2C2F1_9BURK|nr:PsiF family protein [Scleromatobacter humisilvae]MCK9685895.1 PsiF family protein [Scleromatobacter humisilvae]